MKNLISIELYHHSQQIEVNGFVFKSSYNHNYYINSDNNDIILETCNDDNEFFYYKVIGASNLCVKTSYLGTGYFTYSIWSEFFDGEVKNGCVELDTEIY